MRLQWAVGAASLLLTVFAAREASACSGADCYTTPAACPSGCPSGYQCTASSTYSYYPPVTTWLSAGDIAMKQLPSGNWDTMTKALNAMNLRRIHVGMTNVVGGYLNPQWVYVENTASSPSDPSVGIVEAILASVFKLGTIELTFNPADLVSASPGVKNTPIDGGWMETPLVFYRSQNWYGSNPTVNLMQQWIADPPCTSGICYNPPRTQPHWTYSLAAYTNWQSELWSARSQCAGTVVAANQYSGASRGALQARWYSPDERRRAGQLMWPIFVNSIFERVNAAANSSSFWIFGMSLADQRMNSGRLAAQILNCFSGGDCNSTSTSGWVGDWSDCGWYGPTYVQPNHIGQEYYVYDCWNHTANMPRPPGAEQWGYTVAGDDIERQILTGTTDWSPVMYTTPFAANWGQGQYAYHVDSYSCTPIPTTSTTDTSGGTSTGGTTTTSGGTCFVAGTPVEMADGTTKPIEDVHIGDEVLSYDETTGAVTSGPVVNTFVHPDTPGLTIVNGITTTPEHRFFVDGTWKRADHLQIGDHLFTASAEPNALGTTGVSTVERVYQAPGGVTTYNFEVGRTHTYFVKKVLVHNRKAICTDC